MPSLDNLNFNRNYKITFFDTVQAGSGFNIVELPYVLSGIREFSFDYTITNQTLNTAKFTFYNLSQDSINLFSSNNNRRGFYVQCWYGDFNTPPPGSYIFKGLTFTSNTYRSGPDLITEVVGCDIFLNLLYKGIAQNFPANTSSLTIINYILNYYGSMMSLSDQSRTYLTKVYKSPKMFKGNILEIFKSIASDNGLLFAIKNNTLYFVPNKTFLPQSTTVSQIISPTNGLVGNVKAEALSVQLFPVTYFDVTPLDKNASILTVTTLLRSYAIYDTVKLSGLSNPTFNRNYGILSLTQRGEYRGNAWYSILKLIPAV